MSATDRTAADFESAAVAHVHFRVRCETLGHGEEVFLVPDGGGAAKVRDDAVTTRHTHRIQLVESEIERQYCCSVLWKKCVKKDLLM